MAAFIKDVAHSKCIFFLWLFAIDLEPLRQIHAYFCEAAKLCTVVLVALLVWRWHDWESNDALGKILQ